jgi:hypothetical protein
MDRLIPMAPLHRRAVPRVLRILPLLLSPLAASAQEAQRLGPAGGEGGTAFADTCTVASVLVNAGWWVDGIQVLCRETATQYPLHGGAGGGHHRFDLQPGERIVAISGWTLGNSGYKVYGIEFHTDRRSSGMFGNGGDEKGRNAFRFDVPAGWAVQGIVGRSDARSLLAVGLDVVAASYAAPPPPPPPVMPGFGPRLVSPETGEVMDNGCDGSNSVDWRFAWTPVAGATRYHLWVARDGSANPAVNQQVSATEWAEARPGYIASHNLAGWQWRVRAMVNGVWSQWSQGRRFVVEPLGTDCTE